MYFAGHLAYYANYANHANDASEACGDSFGLTVGMR
jgi:hypothetical protein